MKFSKEQINILHNARLAWGDNDQHQMVVGEFGELLTLFGRKVQGRDNAEDWITEIADCMVMLEQLALMYGYNSVQNKLDEKMSRLHNRISAYNNRNGWSVVHHDNGDFSVVVDKAS